MAMVFSADGAANVEGRCGGRDAGRIFSGRDRGRGRARREGEYTPSDVLPLPQRFTGSSHARVVSDPTQKSLSQQANFPCYILLRVQKFLLIVILVSNLRHVLYSTQH